MWYQRLVLLEEFSPNRFADNRHPFPVSNRRDDVGARTRPRLGTNIHGAIGRRQNPHTALWIGGRCQCRSK